ncbi:MAG: acetate/propionate family kinase [Xanthobacteraceae bacterium]|jgi:acetate kinase
MDAILVVNAGSSSVKFQIFDQKVSGDPQRLIKGQFDGIGTRPRLRAEARDGKPLIDTTYTAQEIADVATAIGAAGNWLRETQKIELAAVGHRVVHGGPDYDRAVVINKDVLKRLEQFSSLAPLHQPNNLAPIRTLMARRPELLQVACFDTAFHRSHSPLADHYAIPERFYQEGVRRYGFHGLSYEYIAGRLPELNPAIAKGRVIVAHLGSGASMCALANGRSVESTMGFTALDGLPMGTRPGQIDPGVLLYLIAQKGMSAKEVEDLLYRQSGLKGLSGISNDMRELEASASPAAALAIDYFVYRIALNAGMLAAALNGLDAFIFTAGIGENSASIRARVAEKLAWLGVNFDAAANKAGGPLISTLQSKVAVYVISTDEELMIARHTISLLSRATSVASLEKT